jgi:hypothetical protein
MVCATNLALFAPIPQIVSGDVCDNIRLEPNNVRPNMILNFFEPTLIALDIL